MQTDRDTPVSLPAPHLLGSLFLSLSISPSLSMCLPLTWQLSCRVCRHLWGQARGTAPRRPQVRGESPSYSCLSPQRWGAAEWGQCKPGLTFPTLWLTRGSEGAPPAAHSTPLFLLLLSGRASEIFQSFKELFFAERGRPVMCVGGITPRWPIHSGAGETGYVGVHSWDFRGISGIC